MNSYAEARRKRMKKQKMKRLRGIFILLLIIAASIVTSVLTKENFFLLLAAYIALFFVLFLIFDFLRSGKMHKANPESGTTEIEKFEEPDYIHETKRIYNKNTKKINQSAPKLREENSTVRVSSKNSSNTDVSARLVRPNKSFDVIKAASFTEDGNQWRAMYNEDVVIEPNVEFAEDIKEDEYIKEPVKSNDDFPNSKFNFSDEKKSEKGFMGFKVNKSSKTGYKDSNKKEKKTINDSIYEDFNKENSTEIYSGDVNSEIDQVIRPEDIKFEDTADTDIKISDDELNNIFTDLEKVEINDKDTEYLINQVNNLVNSNKESGEDVVRYLDVKNKTSNVRVDNSGITDDTVQIDSDVINRLFKERTAPSAAPSNKKLRTNFFKHSIIDKAPKDASFELNEENEDSFLKDTLTYGNKVQPDEFNEIETTEESIDFGEAALSKQSVINNPQELIQDKTEDKKDVKAESYSNQTINKSENKKEKAVKRYNSYSLPVNILKESPPSYELENEADLMNSEISLKLIETLKSFGVGARIINVSKGPAITRYEIQPDAGVKVSKIVRLADDISLNLASAGVRIEAPIPGKAAVGIEVPNKEVSMVALHDVIDSDLFQKFPSKLAFAVGKDVSGNIVVGDIQKMPHLLIAGATGSGKSVCINTLIASILYKATPEEVKLVMIDPKVVELGIYNGIPHLLIPVVTDPKKAAGALCWAVQEMERRYQLFANKNVREIRSYNMSLFASSDEKLPHIIVIIDELADLMMVASNDVEDYICRLAQKARAAGIHLVVATQRPSVDVITGLIKANIPSRIAFSVSSQIDSRTIIDMAGAEKLLGRGDMLFYPMGMYKPMRVQGAFVSDGEIEGLVSYLKSTYGEAEYSKEVSEQIENRNDGKNEHSDESGNVPANDDEAILNQAVEIVLEYNQASISFLQRKLKLGYSRAARIIDQMEDMGIVSSGDGSKPRQILINSAQWESMRG